MTSSINQIARVRGRKSHLNTEWFWWWECSVRHRPHPSLIPTLLLLEVWFLFSSFHHKSGTGPYNLVKPAKIEEVVHALFFHPVITIYFRTMFVTFTWWVCFGLCLWHKPVELAQSFLFCSCVCFCLYDPFNCISFHKFSWQLSAFCSSGLISALLVLSTIYLFIKVSFGPDIILCGWLGLKRQPAN